MRGKDIKNIVLAVLSIIVVWQFLIINKMDNEIFNMNNNTQMIMSSISGLGSNIQSIIYDEIGRSHLVKNKKFSVNKFEQGKAVIDVVVDLSKVNNGEKVIFSYKKNKDSNWEDVELTKASELTYIGTMIMDFEYEYNYKVVTTGEISESSDIEYIDKYEFIQKPPSIGYGYDTENFSIFASVDEYYISDNALDIDHIEIVTNFSENIKTYNSTYKEKVLNSDGSVLEWPSYDVTIPRSEISGDFNNITMKVVYVGGITDSVDITEECRTMIMEIKK